MCSKKNLNMNVKDPSYHKSSCELETIGNNLARIFNKYAEKCCRQFLTVDCFKKLSYKKKLNLKFTSISNRNKDLKK